MLSSAAANRLRIASRVGYIIVVLLATLSDLRVDPDPARIAERFHRALEWTLTASAIPDAVRNVALFAGFGVVWIITSQDARPRRRVPWITFYGFILSVSVEVVQLLSMYRSSSINDVATNTSGALLGAVTILLMVDILRRIHPRRMYIGFPLYPVAGAYAMAVATDIFAPFYWRDRFYGPGGSVLDRLAYALHFVRGPGRDAFSMFDLVAGSPAGFLVVVALAELGLSYGAACALTIAGGVAASVGLEIFHGIAGQRIQVGPMISHIVAISAGALIAWRLAPAALRRIDRQHTRAAIILAASAALLVVWSWRPFELNHSLAEIRSQLSLLHFIPLGLMGGEIDLFGVTDLVRQFALFLALGVLLAVWPLRQRGWLAFVLPALYLAVILEVGQLFVVGRTFDITDVLTQWAAAAVGYVLVRRAGWTVVGTILDRGSISRKPQIIYPLPPPDPRHHRRGSHRAG
ncbi:MAG TPA: VanZ family protein [Gemmatimonadaceae bacterium]|nr:VanZ family protein [Gemmatimonadaceae bacterium]